jgi:trimeric autotransporter adhesin
MKNRTVLFTTILLVCLGFLPGAQGVIPAPDGGYPGSNTAEGQNALLSLNVNTGTDNTAVGWWSLKSNVQGDFNTAIGSGALTNNIGNGNTAIGGAALFSNTTGGYNTAAGLLALFDNTDGDFNTATGNHALRNNTSGTGNIAIGHAALFFNTTGNGNIALGNNAGLNLTTGSGNINIGNLGVAGESGFIRIGNNHSFCFISGIYGRLASGGAAVYIKSDGQLGTSTSSRRFKEEIKPMQRTSEVLFALKPVTFRYKKEIDPQGIPQFGLVAEDVEKVNPDLVVRDGEGKLSTVRYEAINAMLLNEFLKEHKKVEEQRAAIAQQRRDFEAIAARQQRQIEELTAQLKEQAAQIQRVSAQVEMSNSAPHLVLNDQ